MGTGFRAGERSLRDDSAVQRAHLGALADAVAAGDAAPK